MSKISASLLKLIKFGNVSISDGDKKILELSFSNTIKTINIIDFTSNVPSSSNTLKKLIQARDFAMGLNEKKITLAICHKNKMVMKLGHDAHPRLSRLITKSHNIEIMDLSELRRLDKRIRLK